MKGAAEGEPQVLTVSVQVQGTLNTHTMAGA